MPKKYEDLPEYVELTKLLRRTWDFRTANAFLSFFAKWQDLLGITDEEGGIDLSDFRGDLKLLKSASTDLDVLKNASTEKLIQYMLQLEEKISVQELDALRLSEAMSGDMVLVASSNVSISAADLNDPVKGAAGSFTRQTPLTLLNAKNEPHYWCGGTFDVATTGKSNGAAVYAAPTATAGKTISGGVMVKTVFDTDGGSTKIYAAGESLTVTGRVSTTDSLLGYTVTSVLQAFDVIA